MSETIVKKKEWYLPYTYYDVEAYTNHFEKMALSGWKLCNEGDHGKWLPEYQSITPATIHYAGYLTKNTSSMTDDEEDCFEEFKNSSSALGWKYVCTFHGQLHIFESTEATPVELSTDDEAEFAAIHHAMRGQMISSGCIAAMWIAFLMFAIVVALIDDRSSYDMYYGLMFCSLYLFQVVNSSTYFSWYRNKKRELALSGTLSKSHSNASASFVLHIVVAIFIILWLIPAFNPISLLVSNVIAIAFLSFAIIFGLKGRRIYQFDSGTARKWKPLYYIAFAVFCIAAIGIDLFQATRLL